MQIKFKTMQKTCHLTYHQKHVNFIRPSNMCKIYRVTNAIKKKYLSCRRDKPFNLR